MSRSQGHSATGRIMLIQNYTDTIGNRTHDLPACSAVPQTTATPHALAYSAQWFCDVLNCISIFGMIKEKIRRGFPAVCSVRQCNETTTKANKGPSGYETRNCARNIMLTRSLPNQTTITFAIICKLDPPNLRRTVWRHPSQLAAIVALVTQQGSTAFILIQTVNAYLAE